MAETAEQLTAVLAQLQQDIANLRAELNQEKAANVALRAAARAASPPVAALPASVKPQLPPCFHGKMDGTSVSRFVHQLDTYFKLVDLTDDVKRGQIAVTLLDGAAYTWYSVQGGVEQWSRLKARLLGYFKPADYAYKTRQSLANWRMRGSVTEYITGFAERFTQCVDVNGDEALFRFLDGLTPQLQAWVRTQKPLDLQAAMQAAEEVGSTLAISGHSNPSATRKGKRQVAVPVLVGHGRRDNDYAPMELGAVARFSGTCFNCGKPGHKAAQCKARNTTAAKPTSNRPQTSKQNSKAKFNNLQAALSVLQSALSSEQSSSTGLQQSVLSSQVSPQVARGATGSAPQPKN